MYYTIHYSIDRWIDELATVLFAFSYEAYYYYCCWYSWFYTD